MTPGHTDADCTRLREIWQQLRLRRIRSYSVLQLAMMSRCPEHLEKFWLGHENRDIGHEYAEMLQEDVEWRQEIAAQVRIGVDIPEPSVVPSVPKKRSKKELATAA
jgi:hypothetical protein